jgi:hypothetical protein
LNSTGTAALVLSSITITGTNAADFSQTNNCGTTVNAGASCTINVIFTPGAAGSRTATLTVTDNASPSTQTVALTGTGAASTVSLSGSSLTFAVQTMVGSSTPAQTLTLNNTGTATLTIASITPSGDFSLTDTCGASVSAGANCAINIIFTPTAVGIRTGTLTITDNSNGVAGTQQTVALTGTGFASNNAAVNVNFGPNGTGPVTASSSPYFNGIFTTVTVCQPGSTNCATIPDVLVDTGSVGLRLLASGAVNATAQVSSLNLPAINDSSTGLPIYECVQYGDLSYTWGPLQMATVQVGGETASQIPTSLGGTANSGIPIQVISTTTTPPKQIYEGPSSSYSPIYNPCLVNPSGTLDTASQYDGNTVQTLGANGILGVGNYAQDCGVDCTTLTLTINDTNGPYMVCSSTACGLQGVAVANQVWNPVSAFASADTNGVVVQLPSIPAAGQATAAGSLVFGIGTQTCTGAPSTCTANGLAGAQVYALDVNGNFPSTQLNGLTYNLNTDGDYGAFLDSGTNILAVSDATTLGIADCYIGGTASTDDTGYYCPSSTLALSNFALTDNNGVTTPALGLSIANALTLFGNLTSPTNAAFNNLGGDSGAGSTSDYFDLGLPFFFGRNVFVGIMGTSAPNGVSVPNGYWAF